MTETELIAESVEADIGALIADREKTHGDFYYHAAVTQAIKHAMRATPNWEGLSDIQVESLEMIAHKIGRILAGDPNCHDHWQDLAGYSKLVANRIPSPQ